MPDLFSILFPIFAVVAVGYFAAFRGVLTPSQNSGLSRFVFVIAIPVLLFDSLLRLEFSDEFRWEFLIAYYVPALGIYALGMLFSRLFFKAEIKEQAIFGLGSSFSNNVLVGLPIVAAALGERGLLPMLILISIHSLVLFTVFLLLVERNREGVHWRRGLQISAINLVRNPLIVSLLAGLAARFLDLQIPRPIVDTLDLLGQAALPCALIVLGASLREFRIRGEVTKAWTVVVLKLMVLPFFVWVFAFHLFHLEPLWGTVAVIAAGLPVGVNVYIMAENYQIGRASISASILLSTLLALASQSILLTLLL